MYFFVLTGFFLSVSGYYWLLSVYSTAGDGRSLLTGVSRYVSTAMVVSTLLLHFLRICFYGLYRSFCSSICFMVVKLDVVCLISRAVQKVLNFSNLKHGPLSEITFSVSPSFPKFLCKTFATSSDVPACMKSNARYPE